MDNIVPKEFIDPISGKIYAEPTSVPDGQANLHRKILEHEQVLKIVDEETQENSCIDFELLDKIDNYVKQYPALKNARFVPRSFVCLMLRGMRERDYELLQELVTRETRLALRPLIEFWPLSRDENPVLHDLLSKSCFQLACEMEDWDVINVFVHCLKINELRFVCMTPEVKATLKPAAKGRQLHQAVKEGNLHMCKFLVEACGYPADLVYGESNMFYVACKDGRDEIVDWYLDVLSFDSNSSGRGDGISPLQIAAHKGHASIVSKLLQHGADVNKSDRRHHTPLMEACVKERLDVLELLLARPDIDLIAKRSTGETALHIATEQGNAAILEKLIARARSGELLEKIVREGVIFLLSSGKANVQCFELIANKFFETCDVDINFLNALASANEKSKAVIAKAWNEAARVLRGSEAKTSKPLEPNA